MTKTSEGVFEIDVEFKGTNSFGFVKTLGGDWTAFSSCRYTRAERGTVPVVSDNDMLSTGDDSNDYSWDLGAGKYHFTVNTNTMKFILSSQGVVPPTPPTAGDLYFTGEVNDWSFLDDYLLTADGKVYTYITGMIRGGLSFKIANRSWNPAYTIKNEAMVPGNVYEVFTGDGLPDMALAEDFEDAILTLDTEAMTLTVGTSAGVDNIAFDSNAAPEYFTLQGMRIENPSTGIYLVRNGSQVTKVYLK